MQKEAINILSPCTLNSLKLMFYLHKTKGKNRKMPGIRNTTYLLSTTFFVEM